MVWARYDDGFHSNKKVAKIRGENDELKALAAIGLHVLMNTYQHQEKLAGQCPAFLPRLMAPKWGLRLAKLLEDAKLLDPCEAGGWEFHDHDVYGPPPGSLSDVRSKAGKRGAAARWDDGKPDGKSMANGMANGWQTDGSRVDAPVPERARPVPTSSLREEGPPRIDVEQICNLLGKLMVENDCKPPVITAKWRTEARLLLDKDGRPRDEVERVLRWCQADTFWRSNIHSLPTFREKYDTLRQQMQAAKPQASGYVGQWPGDV